MFKLNSWTTFFIILYLGMLLIYLTIPNPVLINKVLKKKYLKESYKDKHGNLYNFS